MTTDKYPDLVRKLKEIFQIDKPELDFGVYRVLNARRREIENFLDNRLKARVEAALNASAVAERDAVAAELRKAEENARALGADPDTLPKVKELRDKLSALSSAANDAESLVYAHLLAFFSRYYEDGDFISQRRYKDGVYAIPYAGEEVKLHWANADQYYTKTGESFTNYDFPLDGGLRVRFHLVTAETAKDNVKDNDAVRCFKLWDPAETPECDPDDEEETERIKALYPADFIEEKDNELVIHFQYLKFPKKTNQEQLMKEAAERILKSALVTGNPKWRDLSRNAVKGDGKEDNKTILFKHLDRYSKKNSSDYFIHKDLGKFLRQELDFYVKNEMMHLDEVDRDATGESIVANLRTIRTFRAVAHELIDFMAQLENFQKKLWLKKKFVVQCDWCMTLDIVREHAPELLPVIFANKKQVEKWQELGVDADPRATNLTATDARMVDTKFFDEAFKSKLLADIPDLDARTDGILVHSENFQALRLMQERYKEQVKCIYIDPPYNTGSDGFLYKDGYKDSSWLSMMMASLRASFQEMSSDCVIFTSVDYNENYRYRTIMDSLCGSEGFVGEIHWESKTKSQNTETSFNKLQPKVEIIYVHSRKPGRRFNLIGIGQREYPLSDEQGSYREYVLEVMNAEDSRGRETMIYSITDGVSTVSPPAGKQWKLGQAQVSAYINSHNLFIRDEKVIIKMRPEFERTEKAEPFWGFFPKDLGTSESAKAELKKMIPDHKFETVKPVGVVQRVVFHGSNPDSLILDFFAGSGTTGHAVIDLNRLDKEKGVAANRKYILVEMGEHFETVLKRRIEKVVYSPKWRDGKPENTDKGISHCFKYLTLESYEDTLNNLELKRPDGAAPDLLGSDEYLLRYMLDVEARGSLLSTDDFRHPFDYEMKIATDSSGAYARRKIDLVETFNWLVGLRVESEERLIDSRSCVLVEGTLPNGERALVAWRDVDKVDTAALAALLKSQGYLTDGKEKPAKEVNVLYVNGDHSLRPVISAETGETKVRSIEEEFLSRMFGEAR